MNPTPNGGFLASWGPDGTWDGSPAVYQGSAPLAQPSQVFSGGISANPGAPPPTLAQNNPADFQTAGGSGGGFTNFSSWMAANPTMQTKSVAQAQQDPALNTALSKPKPKTPADLMQTVVPGMKVNQ